MESCDKEELVIDVTYDIAFLVYCALKETISASMESPTSIKKRLAQELDALEDDCYATTGADGKVFLCGKWLNRTIASNSKSMKMLDYLKFNLTFDDVEYLPDTSGVELRKMLWITKSEKNSSYDVPKACRIDYVRDERDLFDAIKFPKFPEEVEVVTPKKMLEDLVKELSDDDAEKTVAQLEEVASAEDTSMTEKQKQMLDQLVDSVLDSKQ